MKKVFVAVPCMDMVHAGFTSSLTMMFMHSLYESFRAEREFRCGLEFMVTSMLLSSRHLLTKVAMAYEHTHILFVDSDMTFPRDMLIRLMAHDKPIVGINAMARAHPYRCTAQGLDGNQLETTSSSTGLVRVKRTGFGVMYIDLDVFRRMELPWYNFVWQPEHERYLGEDYNFCAKARDLGYDIWVDQDLSKEVKHLGMFPFEPMMAEQLKEELSQLEQKVEKMNAGSEQLQQ